MLDMKYVLAHLEQVGQAMKNRNETIDLAQLVDWNDRRKAILSETETMRAQKNQVSSDIPRRMKDGEDVAGLKQEMREVAERIKELEQELGQVEDAISGTLLTLPNLPFADVPVGKDESENVELRQWGEPTRFDFEPKAHWDIGQELNILDPETAAKLSGSRYTLYRGLGARLERSLMNLMMDTHAENGYTELLPPYLVTRKTMTGTGQLPKFEDDAFKVIDQDIFLIPTSEVPVTNMLSDQIIMEQELPQKYTAYSACFRAEAGSAGRDTRGLVRQHQFNKVEMVHFSTPEQWEQQLEALTAEAELILQKLQLPYRVIVLCTGDMGFGAAKTYDIEVWMPSYNRYVEISSCSCCGDFQARRMNLRYKKDVGSKPQYPYTYNGSGLAVGRTTAAVLENFQQKDGSIIVPEAIRGYMGRDVIR